MRVFVSCSKKDEKITKQLETKFRQYGIIPFFFNIKEAFERGMIDRINESLDRADYAFILFSNAYNKDNWFKTEQLALMQKETSNNGDFIVPIKIEDCSVPETFNDRIVADFSNSFDTGIKQLLSFIAEKRRVFVVMKLGDPSLDDAYEGAIKVVAEKYKYSVLRVDEPVDSGYIPLQILEGIKKSDLVIADLTDDRPNCFFEVGYTMGLGKDVILTRRNDGVNIPFDLAGNRCILWKTQKELKEKLERAVQAVQVKINKEIM